MLRLGLLLVLLAIGGCAASGDEAVVPSDVRTVHLAGRFEHDSFGLGGAPTGSSSRFWLTSK